MIRKSGNRFSGKITRQEIPSLYIVAMRTRLSRGAAYSLSPVGRGKVECGLALMRRTGKLPQSAGIESDQG
jgi:hypothetical protein